MRSLLRSTATVLATILALAACTSSPAAPTAYASVSPGTIEPGDAIPAPADAPILTVTGAISAHNDGSEVALDMATLESIGLVRYAVDDPWLAARHEYTGVLLADLLDTLGAATTATTVTITALDDYQVDIDMADIRRWPILLATASDGARMAVADKGPTRIVFPYHAYPEIDQLTYKDLWIWQLATIEVG
jgi:hypothetical protein